MVTLSGDDTCVRLTVHDDSVLQPVATTSDEVMVTCGRGLDIVESVSNDRGVSSSAHGTKSVWASFGIAQESAEATRHQDPRFRRG